MDLPDREVDIEVLDRRRDFLEFLRAPAEKPTLVEELGHSRSTVDRAVRTLEDAGFVERTGAGYRTTVTGKLAMERYDEFLEDSQMIVEHRALLSSLPPSLDIPLAAVTNGTVESVDDSYRLFEILLEDLERAQQYHAVLPKMADSRQLRLVHSHVTSGTLDATIATRETVYQQVSREFPHLSLDLQESEQFTALEIEPDGVGIVVSEPQDVVTLVVYDEETVGWVVRCRDEETHTWAREYVREAEGEAIETTSLGSEIEDTPHQFEGGLPATLRSQGFERVDQQYFENRSVVDPATAWRAGVRLPGVAAGYAVERTWEQGDEERSMSESVLAKLEDGTDIAILGPPGSGKSTVCKQVAYEWFDGQHGTVLYRESGQNQSFESDVALEQALRQAEEHVLVVVEDAVRTDANAVIEVMQRFAEDDRVTFLLDARASEWYDEETVPESADLESFRQSHVETVQMPPLSKDEQQEMLRRFEQFVDGEFEIPSEQLLGPITKEDHAAGHAFLFFHRLARYANPETAEQRGQLTTLDEHVESVRQKLSEEGETVLKIGVLANVLNAAGIGVSRGYLHAIGAKPDGDHEAVEAAIAILDGEVLFGTEASDSMRTVHSAWSLRFLDRLLAGNGRNSAASVFGNGITALLALADEPERRRSVVEAVPESSERIADIAASPETWADELTSQVFELGEAYPKLADLYGPTEGSSITLPDACSRAVRLEQHKWRGHMYNWANQFERAKAEYSALVSTLEDPTETGREQSESWLYARAMLGLARIALSHDTELARERAQQALEAYQAVGDDYGIAKTRMDLATLVAKAGEIEAANRHVELAAELAETIGDPYLEVKAKSVQGQHAVNLGEFDEARAKFQAGLQRAREAGIRRSEKSVLRALSEFSLRLGAFDDVETYSQQALDISAETGETQAESNVYTTLAHSAIERGQFEQAQERLDRAEAACADGAFVPLQIAIDNTRARLEVTRGELTGAADRFRSVMEQAAEHGLERYVVGGEFYLAATLLEDGNIDAAREHAEHALQRAREAENPEVLARAQRVRGTVAVERGESERAREAFEQALETFEQFGDRFRAARCRHGLGNVERLEGADERAIATLEGALETLQELHANRVALEVVEDLAEIDSAQQWYTVGAEIAEQAGLQERAATLQERATTTAEETPEVSD